MVTTDKYSSHMNVSGQNYLSWPVRQKWNMEHMCGNVTCLLMTQANSFSESDSFWISDEKCLQDFLLFPCNSCRLSEGPHFIWVNLFFTTFLSVVKQQNTTLSPDWQYLLISALGILLWLISRHNVKSVNTELERGVSCRPFYSISTTQTQEKSQLVSSTAQKTVK